MINKEYFLRLFQSECRIIMPIPQTPENLVLQAVMDEFEENREKGNLTAEILNKERVSVGTFKSYTFTIK